MNDQNEISDELLNAYIDGELSEQEQTEVVAALRKNPNISEKLCQLRTLKEMLKISYQNPPASSCSMDKEKEPFVITRTMSSLAASILLVLVLGAGAIGGFQYAQTKQSVYPQLTQIKPAIVKKQHILLHIGTNKDERIQLALDNAEHLLNSFAANNKKIVVQILVNSEAINMLNTDDSPYIERIQNLSSRYENVAFLACQRSIERQMLKGVKVQLVREAKVIPEALQAIVNRLENGWAYIRA
jgi:uncharacterized protein